jgi:hypothetical protein
MEPTDAMIKAAEHPVFGGSYRLPLPDAYRAMIRAAQGEQDG